MTDDQLIESLRARTWPGDCEAAAFRLEELRARVAELEALPGNSAAFLLAEEYNARCEAYDQKVCTGPTTRDGIQPADGRELGLISRNAIAVLADVTIKALDQGVTVDELRQAISKLP